MDRIRVDFPGEETRYVVQSMERPGMQFRVQSVNPAPVDPTRL